MSSVTNSQFCPWDDKVASSLIDEYKELDGALMVILGRFIDIFGYINLSIAPQIANALNLSRAEVHGVITFYHDFRTEVPGRKVIKICRAESCQAMGGNELIEHAKRVLSTDFYQTTKDGSTTLEPVYCLGNCACSPSVMIGDELHGRVTPEQFDYLIDKNEKEDVA